MASLQQLSELRDGMRIDWNVPITMDDGLVLRADVFRPAKDGQYPVLLTYGPYAKNLAFQDGYPSAWNIMVEKHPDVTAGSSNKYQNWEVVDPEKWVPHDYVCVRVDSRGAGCSPGFIDHFSPRETKDFYDCIEWAGVQPWSNGKVGLNGISYYGMNQWHVASLQPPHLAAMCVWEGSADWYRDMTHHGGILSTFWENWYDMQVKTVQYGAGERGKRSRVHGELVCGPETLSDEELAKNRADFGGQILAHPIDDKYHRDRSPVWEKVTTPLFSAANWGGQGLHPRGNFEGFVRAASKEKWLEAHGIEHWTHFYTDYGREQQLRFFDYFLHGKKDGWAKQPKVLLQVRHPGEKFVARAENEWPIARTQMDQVLSRSQIDGARRRRSRPAARRLSLRSHGRRPHLPHAAASSTKPRSPDRRRSSCSPRRRPRTPISSSCCACSPATSRKSCSRARSIRTRRSRKAGCAPRTASSTRNCRCPTGLITRHDKKQPLTKGKPVELDIEIWPTSIAVPAGYRVGLSMRGKDYEYGGASGGKLSNFKNELTGCGPFLHNEPGDRPPAIFGGTTTLHFSRRKIRLPAAADHSAEK